MKSNIRTGKKKKEPNVFRSTYNLTKCLNICSTVQLSDKSPCCSHTHDTKHRVDNYSVSEGKKNVYLILHDKIISGNLCLLQHKGSSHRWPQGGAGVLLFFADEVLMAHLGDTTHQVDKLTEVHTVALVGVQVLEDAIDRFLVIGFLQARNTLA